MTQEEKAKAYDKALERAKMEMSKDGMKNDVIAIHLAETIFPELKGESEDERISKEIIEYLERTIPHHHRDEVLKSKEWIAWLEKQGEQKPAWSKEDEVKINRIVACLENLNVADNDILLKDVDWLKSLRPQNTWKPSDMQMKALHD